MASSCAFMLKDTVTAIGGLLNARLEKSASAAPLKGQTLLFFIRIALTPLIGWHSDQLCRLGPCLAPTSTPTLPLFAHSSFLP